MPGTREDTGSILSSSCTQNLIVLKDCLYCVSLKVMHMVSFRNDKHCYKLKIILTGMGIILRSMEITEKKNQRVRLSTKILCGSYASLSNMRRTTMSGRN